ncbi:hypothetical protein M8C21_012443 [Ambrosia artemisiifolia]|uniref:Uncharacterized protein n=1 Tax=Ambrosia artemisiifolia TaxID=4212 RepID=A0AAD5CUQ7_AMBAR|nr:hypothetical protein M8C21_012443 [Ambrosia artemisiifolia]
MHFQMKIQPINNHNYDESMCSEAALTVKPPVLKSRLKRLFDRQFPSVLKNNPETVNGAIVARDGEQFEPSSICLAKMVQNFIEDAVPEKPKCGRNRCNCFNGNMNDSSDDETIDGSGFYTESDSCEALKSVMPCPTVVQRNLLADVSKIVEKSKAHKRKDELRKLVADELVSIGHDASICKSSWEKSSTYPAGEYEYIYVVTEDGDRIIIDLEFRSEFEIARPTGNYKAILHSLPNVFVGDADRLQQILLIISEAAKLSLKKKGMHVPPWRKFEYMRSKWLSTPLPSPLTPPTPPPTPNGERKEGSTELETECGVFEMVLGEETTSLKVNKMTEKKSDDGLELTPAGEWKLPALKPRSMERGSKLVVTGLGSLFREK